MSGSKLLALIVSIMVGTAIIYGFIVAGSPGTARSLKFDQQRVNDLQQLSRAIERYVWERGRLPSSLSEMAVDSDYSDASERLTDPETGAEYEYQVTDDTHYELCAVFYASSDEQDDRYYREPYPVPLRPGAKFLDPEIDPFSLPRPEGRYCYNLEVSFEDMSDAELAE